MIGIDDLHPYPRTNYREVPGKTAVNGPEITTRHHTRRLPTMQQAQLFWSLNDCQEHRRFNLRTRTEQLIRFREFWYEPIARLSESSRTSGKQMKWCSLKTAEHSQRKTSRGLLENSMAWLQVSSIGVKGELREIKRSSITLMKVKCSLVEWENKNDPFDTW